MNTDLFRSFWNTSGLETILLKRFLLLDIKSEDTDCREILLEAWIAFILS